MKKVLMLCFLLVALSGASQAMAAQFYFGSAAFDDQSDLLTNLNNLLPSGSEDAFAGVSNADILDLPKMHVKVIGLSSALTDGGHYFWLGTAIDGFKIMSSNNLPKAWNAESEEYKISDLQITAKPDANAGSHYSLASVLKGLYSPSYVTAVGAYFYGGELVYQPDGYSPVVFTGGTHFIGLSFTGSGNTLDAIIAFSFDPIQSPVPVPAAVWLMGSGLAGIIALRKRMA